MLTRIGVFQQSAEGGRGVANILIVDDEPNIR